MRYALPPLFVVIGFTLGGFQAPGVQIEAIEAQVSYRFDEQVSFSVNVTTQNELHMGILFFQAEGETHTEVGLMQKLPAQGDRSYQLNYTHPIEAYRLPPFSWVEYWLELYFPDNIVIKSDVYRFYYRDNRFTWRSLEEKPFRVFWYEGDVQVAQSALDVAQNGSARIKEILPLPLPETVDIYLYAQLDPLLDVLGESGADWMAGHALPYNNVVLITVPEGPERQLWLSQRIPHELMHLVVAQYAGKRYEKLPVWLREGLASQAELYPNPDYQIVLHYAEDQDSILPMATLCTTFPREASTALLAYAQANSFTNFLVQNYGQRKLIDLMDMYLDGVACERALENVYGSSLTSLERRWRLMGLEDNFLLQRFFNVLPWFVLLLVVLSVPVGLTLHRLSALKT